MADVLKRFALQEPVLDAEDELCLFGDLHGGLIPASDAIAEGKAEGMESPAGAARYADVPGTAHFVDAIGLDDAFDVHVDIGVFAVVGVVKLRRCDFPRLAGRVELFADFLEAGLDDESEIAEAVEVVHDKDVVLIITRGSDGFPQGRYFVTCDIEGVVAGAGVAVHDEGTGGLDALFVCDAVAAIFDLVGDGEFIPGLGVGGDTG